MIFMKDYFQILGLSPQSSEQEVKTAYRKLSKKFHPDLNNQDIYFEKLFKEINEAYEVLSDPYKKQEYLLLNQNSYSQNNVSLEQNYQNALNDIEEKEKFIRKQNIYIDSIEESLKKQKAITHLAWFIPLFFFIVILTSLVLIYQIGGEDIFGNDLTTEEIRAKFKEQASSEQDFNYYQNRDTSPIPAGGIEGFYAYLQREMIYPPQAIENNIEGDVILQLTVDKSGLFKNIVVVKSLGYGCDEEALRLIREAPTWQPAYQSGEKVAMEILFPIPFKLNP